MKLNHLLKEQIKQLEREYILKDWMFLFQVKACVTTAKTVAELIKMKKKTQKNQFYSKCFFNYLLFSIDCFFTESLTILCVVFTIKNTYILIVGQYPVNTGMKKEHFLKYCRI